MENNRDMKTRMQEAAQDLNKAYAMKTDFIKAVAAKGTKWGVEDKHCLYVNLTNRVITRLKSIQTFTDITELEELIMKLLINQIGTKIVKQKFD